LDAAVDMCIDRVEASIKIFFVAGRHGHLLNFQHTPNAGEWRRAVGAA
jgi:hypothetical protein